MLMAWEVETPKGEKLEYVGIVDSEVDAAIGEKMADEGTGE